MEFVTNNTWVWFILSLLMAGFTVFLQLGNMKDLQKNKEFKIAQLASTIVVGLASGAMFILFVIGAIAQLVK